MLSNQQRKRCGAEPAPTVHRVGLPARRQLRDAGVDGAAPRQKEDAGCIDLDKHTVNA